MIKFLNFEGVPSKEIHRRLRIFYNMHGGQGMSVQHVWKWCRDFLAGKKVSGMKPEVEDQELFDLYITCQESNIYQNRWADNDLRHCIKTRNIIWPSSLKRAKLRAHMSILFCLCFAVNVWGIQHAQIFQYFKSSLIIIFTCPYDIPSFDATFRIVMGHH